MMKQVFVFGLLVLGACKSGENRAKPEPTPAAPPPPPSPVPAAPNPLVELVSAPDLKSALAIAGPRMEDGESFSGGHGLLVMWANTRMKWADVSVQANETTYALVAKDSDHERGKRVCLSGSVVEIHADKSVKPTVFTGGIIAESGNVFRFTAVHDTGEIASGSQARFCGVATEYQSYANSGGGTTHAACLVGMFDLPANRTWRSEADGAKPAAKL